MGTPQHADRPPSALERRAEPLVRAILALPPALPVGIVLALIALGVALPSPWGAVPAALAAAVMAGLLMVGWRRLTATEKVMRAAVLLAVLALTAVKAFPR